MVNTSTITLTPPPLTPLIGRNAELARLLDLLRGEVRLVTLTGIGGIGKTRLAHQAALELEPEFHGGSVIVPLAEIRDASLVPVEIGRVFGRAESTIDLQALANMIGDETRLLVLDNLEQIPDVGATIMALLQQSPALTVLATSQVPLDVPGEQLFPLEPMAIQKAETGSLRESPAVELFLHRAKEVDPRLEFDESQLPLVSEICHMLDGIPLAIELAAARLSIFSLQQLREQLSDKLSVLGRNSGVQNDRHRTMRNAIAWSYDLLDTDQQRLFRYLGIYAGSMNLEAIEHTLMTLEITDEPLDVVSRFVGRGFLRRLPTGHQQPRYQMLQTLREFAYEQLELEGDEFNARLAHTTWVRTLAENAEPHLQTEQQDRWLSELQLNADNIRAATEWAAINRPEIALRIISSIWRELDMHGHSRPYINLGRTAIDTVTDKEVLTIGWLAIGSLEVRLRDSLDVATTSLQSALQLARETNNQSAEVRALIGLGTASLHLIKLDDAEPLFSEAINIAEQTNDLQGLYPAKANIGLIALYRLDYDRALALLLDAREVIEKAGDRIAAANMYGNLGLLYNRRKEHDLAKDHLQRAAAVGREIGNVAIQQHALLNLGNSFVALKDYEAAIASYDEGAKVARQAHRVVDEIEIRTAQGQVFTSQEDWLGAAKHFRDTLAITSVEPAYHAIHTCAGVIMNICVRHDRRDAAAGLAGAILGNDSHETNLSAYVKDPGLEFIDSIPEDPNHPERIAFNEGKEWSLATIGQRAMQHATAFIASTTGAESEQPSLPRTAPLTPREREVLGMMAKGHTNAEIADEMFISLRTITTHVSNIFNKLDVKNRAAAVAYALENQLV